MAGNKATTKTTEDHTSKVVPLLSRQSKPRRPRKYSGRTLAPSQVLGFVPRHRGPAVDHDTVRELELLLHNARLGRVTGLIWVASLPDSKGFACDVTGEAARNEVTAGQMAGRIMRLYMNTPYGQRG